MTLRIYQYASILSVDIALGAMISALFFAKLFEVTLRTPGVMALGLTVWIIYTVDHLMDAKRITQEAKSERHRFHQLYFKYLIGVVIIVVIVDGVQLFFIRHALFENGVLLSLIVVSYFVIIRFVKIIKEFFIALVYTSGVVLPSISASSLPLTSEEWIFIFYFGLTALFNVLMFSWFDSSVDEEHKQSSFATIAGSQQTESVLKTLIMVQLLAGIPIILFLEVVPGIILLTMNVILSLIWLCRESTRNNNFYRLAGDAVFFLPGLFLLKF